MELFHPQARGSACKKPTKRQNGVWPTGNVLPMVDTLRRLVLAGMLLLAAPALSSCTTNGMFSHVHQVRVGMGGNNIGTEELHQYYCFFGLARLNEPNIQRVAAAYTSYDITTGCTYWDWFWSTLLLPFTVTRQTVKIDY